MDHLPSWLLPSFCNDPIRTILLDMTPVKLTLSLDPIGLDSTPLPMRTDAQAGAPTRHAETLEPNPNDDVVNESATDERSELLLVCEARSTTLTDGFWRFALETAEGTPVLDAEDEEMGDLNRLTLLAAVRGLEAIEGASSVTLLSNNRYLIRSLSDSLPRWRQNDFIWEHFGRRIDVQHADLWRRVDRALQIHRVEACLLSSRLVSAGSLAGQRATNHQVLNHQTLNQQNLDGSGEILRADAAHQHGSTRSVVPAPTRRSRPSTNQDRLRSWLLESTHSNGSAPPQRRFTSRDLVGNA